MPSFSGVHAVFVRARDRVCMNNSHSIDYSQTVPFNPRLFITEDVWLATPLAGHYCWSGEWSSTAQTDSGLVGSTEGRTQPPGGNVGKNSDLGDFGIRKHFPESLGVVWVAQREICSPLGQESGTGSPLCSSDSRSGDLITRARFPCLTWSKREKTPFRGLDPFRTAWPKVTIK